MRIVLDPIRAGVLFTCLVLPGCGGEAYLYTNDLDIKPGPGLLSGEKGAFTLIKIRSQERANISAQPGPAGTGPETR